MRRGYLVKWFMQSPHTLTWDMYDDQLIAAMIINTPAHLCENCHLNHPQGRENGCQTKGRTNRCIASAQENNWCNRQCCCNFNLFFKGKEFLHINFHGGEWKRNSLQFILTSINYMWLKINKNKSKTNNLAFILISQMRLDFFDKMLNSRFGVV